MAPASLTYPWVKAPNPNMWGEQVKSSTLDVHKGTINQHPSDVAQSHARGGSTLEKEATTRSRRGFVRGQSFKPEPLKNPA